MFVLDPTATAGGPAEKPSRGLAPRLPHLQGKALAIADNGWAVFATVSGRLGELLAQKYGARVVARLETHADSLGAKKREIAEKADAAIVGLGN